MKFGCRQIVCILFVCVAGRVCSAPVYNVDNGHYYELISSGGTWDQARTEAQTLSYEGLIGDLATLTTIEEYNIAKGLTPTWGIVWVGATVDAQGDAFWVNGDGAVNASVTPWDSGQPSIGSYGVALNGSGYGSTLTGKPVAQGQGEFIVEYAAVPEPATASMLVGAVLSLVFYRRMRKAYSIT